MKPVVTTETDKKTPGNAFEDPVLTTKIRARALLQPHSIKIARPSFPDDRTCTETEAELRETPAGDICFIRFDNQIAVLYVKRGCWPPRISIFEGSAVERIQQAINEKNAQTCLIKAPGLRHPFCDIKSIEDAAGAAFARASSQPTGGSVCPEADKAEDTSPLSAQLQRIDDWEKSAIIERAGAILVSAYKQLIDAAGKAHGTRSAGKDSSPPDTPPNKLRQ